MRRRGTVRRMAPSSSLIARSESQVKPRARIASLKIAYFVAQSYRRAIRAGPARKSSSASAQTGRNDVTHGGMKRAPE